MQYLLHQCNSQMQSARYVEVDNLYENDIFTLHNISALKGIDLHEKSIVL